MKTVCHTSGSAGGRYFDVPSLGGQQDLVSILITFINQGPGLTIQASTL